MVRLLLEENDVCLDQYGYQTRRPAKPLKETQAAFFAATGGWQVKAKNIARDPQAALNGKDAS